MGCVREREREGAHVERQVGERRRADAVESLVGFDFQRPAIEFNYVDLVVPRVIGEGMVGQKFAWLASLIVFQGVASQEVGAQVLDRERC